MNISPRSSALIAVVCSIFTASPLTAAVIEEKVTIVVDAGHGGRDVGETANGLVESKVALTMARELAGQLRLLGYKVVLTRGEEKFMLLGDRSAIARKVEPELFISLHTGWSKDANVRGITILHSKLKEGQKQNELAVLLAKSLGNIEPKRGAQIEEARVSAFDVDDFLLLEMGMLSNPDDAKLLANEMDRKEALQVVSMTIDDYLSE